MQNGKSTACGFEAARLSRRINELFTGASPLSGVDMEPDLPLWDFEIEPSLWEIELADITPLGYGGY